MALSNCSLFSLFPPSSNSIITSRRISTLIIVSSISSSNVTHWKKHSRTKILKTLNPKFSLSHQPQEESVEFQDLRVSSGGVQEAKFTKSAHEVITVSLEENQDSGPIFEKDDVHSINGSSRHGLAEKTSAANGDEVKQANTNSDKWWLNLSYVLVILMQRDSKEGQKALYKLKYTSVEQGQSVDSYIVAFEDYGDANNFTVLLESFFEDIDDFSAYPVPMTIQELNEEIASHAKKVVVVKKRQLQLYAGQPFSDVEMSLHSLIEQDQNEQFLR
ncbi:PREDICTED: uncharacterized protein LOC109361551 isoform X2 [Lupinus angustifolius]|uniref:uncharacterized protein LOC109361551 isoform X2 n=1 Tax=Lupinus angustifolius TaxID=3871 RepID=UPI00092F8303|nr:PREDICTED: uncharacterized protein LOC109361551 isoform X2 [Lupinus angustifolius]